MKSSIVEINPLTEQNQWTDFKIVELQDYSDTEAVMYAVL